MDSDDVMGKKISCEKCCIFLFFSTNKNLFQKKGYFFVIDYFCQSRLILPMQGEGNILLPAFQVVLTLQPAALLIICSEEKRQIRPTS